MTEFLLDENWTVFLDRDGVINRRIMGGYVTKIEDFHFLENADEAIVELSKKVKHVFVVTNQQGVAKGLMTECNLQDIHTYMTDKINISGGQIKKCFAAMELKSDPNNTRKPKPNMALSAQLEFEGVNFEKSVMVGDTDSDILFGKNLGMKTVRIASIEPVGIAADVTCNSLYEFVKKYIK